MVAAVASSRRVFALSGSMMTSHASQRGVIALIPQACTSCMLCVKECPSWCISLESHTEEVQQPGARRPQKVNVLDEFTIDFGLCMYCGICVEVCPFDALEWKANFDYSVKSRVELQQGKDRLAGWLSGSSDS